MHLAPVPIAQRPHHWASPIHQQHNFYQVSESVFRSQQPHQQLAALIAEHNIDVVLNLRPRSVAYPQLHVQTLHVPIRTFTFSEQHIVAALQHIQAAEAQGQKILVHCYHGADRTGVVIAMYRIIMQHWAVADAVAEMHHGGYGFHQIWQQRFATLFTPEKIKWIRQQLANPS